MPAPRGGKKPGSRGPVRAVKKRTGRPGRPAPPRRAPTADELGPGAESRPRGFRPAPDHRVESTSGLRHEIMDLRAEVHRLAAEIDKLWARERGRAAATPGRTTRSIAGKPIRTGTRGARPGGRAGPGRAPADRAGSRSGHPAAAGRTGGGPKRTGGTKRSTAWAKPKSKSRRSGTTPRRRGR
jgi:hypothetical protein